jgi:L-asparaginase
MLFNTISKSQEIDVLRLPPKTILCEEGGGTIASVPSPNGKVPKISLQEIFDRALPSSSTLANLIFPERGPVLGELIASPNYQPSHYAKFAEAIFEGLKNDKVEGILLTLGTDTMAFVAAALSEIFPSINKPVVLTGAQRGLDDADSDVTDNLQTSLLAMRFLYPGIYIAFGGTIIEASVVSKISSKQSDGFIAVNSEPVALFDGDTAHLNMGLNRNDNGIIPLTIDTRFDSNIRIETLFPGYSPKVLESILSTESTHGVILRTYGLGNIPARGEGSILSVLQDWANRKPIVHVSQCIDGGTDLIRYEAGNVAHEAGVLESRKLTFELATVRLMRLLAIKNSVKEVKSEWKALQAKR